MRCLVAGAGLGTNWNEVLNRLRFVRFYEFEIFFEKQEKSRQLVRNQEKEVVDASMK